MAQRKRRQSKPATEEMKRTSAMLVAELERWPGVSVRPLFGMWGAWRGERIFAALPRTRDLGAANSVLLKFPKKTAALERRLAADTHIGEFSFGKTKWFRFDVESEADLPALLAWLAEAAG
jgi:hypothetical protein